MKARKRLPVKSAAAKRIAAAVSRLDDFAEIAELRRRLDDFAEIAELRRRLDERRVAISNALHARTCETTLDALVAAGNGTYWKIASNYGHHNLAPVGVRLVLVGVKPTGRVHRGAWIATDPLPKIGETTSAGRGKPVWFPLLSLDALVRWSDEDETPAGRAANAERVRGDRALGRLFQAVSDYSKPA